MNRLSIVRWRQSVTDFKFLKYLGLSLLSSFGALWLVVEISSYFSEPAHEWLSARSDLFFIAGLIIALYLSRPKKSFAYKLRDRDVIVEISTADIFEVDGAIVVPTNTTFDTDLDGRISNAHSVQGKFTREYYGGAIGRLDNDIDVQLQKENYPYEPVADSKPGKTKRFEIGTVVALRKKERLFYLLSLTHISDQGIATGTESDLKDALKGLWSYLQTKGFQGNLVIPVVGTKHARIATERASVIRYIVNSFIESVASNNYCNKLTIALYPPDIVQYDVDLAELDRFLECACQNH